MSHLVVVKPATKPINETAPEGMVFVFGSNLAGTHGAGAAYEAKRRGFPIYLGSGFDNQSGCYAIPTKDQEIQTLGIEVIEVYVNQFMEYAESNGDLRFQVTRIGCGLAGLSDSEVAPLFNEAPPNCYFDIAWRPFLGDNHRYWGTF